MSTADATAGVYNAGFLLPEQPGDARAPLPRLRGEPLSAHVRRAAVAAGVQVLAEASAAWSMSRRTGLPVVLLDPRCPLTPAEFIAALTARVQDGARDRVQVGVRPVTDTVKQVHGDVVVETVERASLLVVTSPVVLPASVADELDVAELDVAGLRGGLAALVSMLRSRFAVDLLEAPSIGRRVTEPVDVLLLETSLAAT